MKKIMERIAVLAVGFLLLAIVSVVFDFTLGTHPISRKGTTETGGAKRRSELGLCLH